VASRVSLVSLEGQILDLVAHDEREMAKLLLDERARVEEARSILLEALPALAIHARAGSEEAFIRACAFIGSNPENWTQDPGVLASRRAGGPPGVSALAPEGGSPAPDTGLARRAGELEARTEAGHLETQLLAPPEKPLEGSSPAPAWAPRRGGWHLASAGDCHLNERSSTKGGA